MYFAMDTSAPGPAVGESSQARAFEEAFIQFANSPLGPVDESPIGFQSQMLWVHIAQVQIFKVGMPD